MLDERVTSLILRFKDYNNKLLHQKKRIILPLTHRLYNLTCFLYGCYLPLNVIIGENCSFKHGLRGSYFAGGTAIGRDCVFHHQVTLGSNYDFTSLGGPPKIGDNVFIGAGVKIIGNITIGDNVRVGAGCVINKSIEDNVTVVCAEPRILIRKT